MPRRCPSGPAESRSRLGVAVSLATTAASVPSFLVGEGQGGGCCKTQSSGSAPPHPALRAGLPHRGGGEQTSSRPLALRPRSLDEALAVALREMGRRDEA